MPQERKYTFKPLTRELWKDAEELFGPRGACAGCWCMYWRLPRKVFDEGKGNVNRKRLKSIVQSGPPPGILAYHKSIPVGWCAFAPRSDYPVLARSRILQPVDHLSVWSVVCFFVHKEHRKLGLTTALLIAAAKYAKKGGAKILEGYPVDPSGSYPDTFAFTGLLSSFQKAGFREVIRRSATRPVMRLNL